MGELNVRPFDLVAEFCLGRILLIGEGNLTFARALGRKKRLDCRLLTVTTFQTESAWTPQTSAIATALRAKGATVIGAVDARNLPLVFGEEKFTVILWNFPFAPAPPRQRGQLASVNRSLMAEFFLCASAQLQPQGKAILTLRRHWFARWHVLETALSCRFQLLFQSLFPWRDFPGYEPITTYKNVRAPDFTLGETYVFGHEGIENA